MPVLDNTASVIEDGWVFVSDDAAIADTGDVIVTLTRLQGEPALAARSGRLGVAVPKGTDADALAPWLDRVSLVAVAFPIFRDGRSFTVARTLRERYGYRGDIRATGHVLPDQFMFLLRSGVTTVELPETADVTEWANARHLQGEPDDEAGPVRALPFLRRTVLPFGAA